MIHVKPQKIKKLSAFYSIPKRQQMAVMLLFTGDKTQAEIANQVGVNPATISVWKRQEMFRRAQDEYNQFMLRDLVSSAVLTLNKLLNAKSEMVRYNAASYVIDKAGILSDAQARKAKVEADLLEHQAKLVLHPEEVGDQDDDGFIEAIDHNLSNVWKGEDKHDAADDESPAKPNGDV